MKTNVVLYTTQGRDTTHHKIYLLQITGNMTTAGMQVHQ